LGLVRICSGYEGESVYSIGGCCGHLLSWVFTLIININFFASTLEGDNLDLKEERQRLQNILITREQQVTSDLNQDIENRLEVGLIERVNPNEEIDVAEIQITPNPDGSISDPTNQNEVPQAGSGANPGFIVR
jgi:hypothetical protein